MVGQELAGYRLRAVLGRGGMSVVYEAENPRLGSIVALKVLAPELATDDVFRARFLKESRIAASLNHPNVVPIYDMGTADDLLYIAMRYVSGADLRSVLRARARISPAQALLLTGQAARALDAAHRNGLVHRDVKPGNILIERGADDDDPDHAYLADFGITKHTSSRSGLTATGEFMGTIDYVAPEQIQGKSVDGRTDEYALGCVLYECLTGRVPFVKDLDAAVIWAHVEETPSPPSTVRPELPPAIDEVVARALAKEPDDRYPTCRELVGAARTALAGFTEEPETLLGRRDDTSSSARRQVSTSQRRGTGDSGSVPPREPPVTPAKPTGNAPGGRRRIAIAIGVCALVIAAAVGAWVALRGNANQASASSGMPASGKSSGMPAAGQSAGHVSASLAANPVWKSLLAQTNQFTGGRLPPARCRAQSSSVVACSDPVPAVDSVRFQVFSSQAALYSAYEAQLKLLGDYQAGTKQLHTNFSNCLADESNGEITWNHDIAHPRHYYSLAESRSGHLTTDQAAGRVYCTLTGSQFDLVWTQDAGHLLAVLTGFPHKAAWQWWHVVHHNIGSGHMSM
jgi:serine/threonine-protein kinase